MNIKETYFENSKEITNSSSSSSTSSVSPLSASSPLNNSQSNQTPPYSTRSSYLGQNYLIDQKAHTNSQMLFNQQNYFDTNQYHHHLHQDLVNPTIDQSNHLYHHHHHQMPSIESSLLTFHNHSHHMSHHYYASNLETANNSEYNQNTAKTNSPVSSSVSPSIKTEMNECENSKKNQVNEGSHNDDTSSSTSSASSVHSNSASSTPFATNNHDSTLIPINDPSYHHYTRNYQNIDYNQQYNQANPNSTSANNRLSVCLKYASTSDQIHMAAAAAAVAAAAVVSNTQSSLLSVPTSSVVSSGVPSSSSSSSISMEDYADGSSPQTHNFNHQMNSISQIHQNRLANPNSSAYSPNHLVGFYNNNLLENSSYYKNSASNLNLSTSSSTSSSSSSYQNQNVLESDYFAYQSYLNNQINESNEMAHTHGQSYPVNSSSPALIQSNHLNSQNAGLSQFNMDQSSILAQQQYLQSNGSANFNNLTNSSYNLTPNSTTSASSSTNLSSTNSRRCSPETTTSTTSTANTASSSTSYQNLKSSTNLQSFNTSYDNSQVQSTSNTNHQTSSSSSSSSTSSSKYQKLNYLNNSHLRLPSSSNGLVQTHHHLGSTSIISQVPASQESIPPNQLCAVCGDNAACQHYGVRTCEGCKGFFKRTVQKNSKYVCLADKNCPVDKRRRNRCQYCRFQKCLAVGMVKEVVRTNDLKGRRGRLPTKPKSPTNSQANSRTQQSAFLSQIVRLFTDTVPNQTSLDFSKYRKITKEIIRIEEEPFWTLQSFTKSCDLIRQWTEKFSTLCRINNLDRDRLFFSNLLDLLVLRIALRMQDNIERIVLCNSIVFHKTQIAYVITSSILQQIQELGSKLKQPDHAISSILSGLLFLQDSSQQSPSQTEVYSKLKELLKEYQQQLQQQKQMNINNNSTNNLTDDSKIPNYYLQMNDIFIQVRQISIQLKQRLKQCNLYNSSVYPSCIPSNSILDLFLQSPDLNMPLTNHQQAPQQQQQQQQIGMQMNHQNSRLFHVQQQQQSIQQTNIRQDLQLNEFNS